MNQWIRLTDREGVPFYCNMANPDIFQPHESGGSMIYWPDGSEKLVKESPDKIAALLEGRR